METDRGRPRRRHARASRRRDRKSGAIPLAIFGVLRHIRPHECPFEQPLPEDERSRQRDHRARPARLRPSRERGGSARHRGRSALALRPAHGAARPASRPAPTPIMRIYNTDGSESGACGNGTRCVAWAMMADPIMSRPVEGDLVLETKAGLLPVERVSDSGLHRRHGPAASRLERDSPARSLSRHPRRSRSTPGCPRRPSFRARRR